MSDILDDVLKRLGVDSYSDLKEHELPEYERWLQALSSQELTVPQIKNYVLQMQNAVTAELVDEPEFIYGQGLFRFIKRVNPQHIMLKARLKNYLLLNAFMGKAEQAKAALEQHLQQIKPIV